MNSDENRIIWIDLEMTGLDSDNDRIIEIATIVTDGKLEIIAEGPVMAIQQPEMVLATMDSWNTRQHTQSGLIERVRQSQITEAVAEQRTIEFLQQHVAAGVSPMAGNSICQDRRFLHRSMPALEKFFHYRNLDVSSIKELAKRWAPSMLAAFSKQPQHLALQDIRDSIDELKYYREHFFNFPDQ